MWFGRAYLFNKGLISKKLVLKGFISINWYVNKRQLIQIIKISQELKFGRPIYTKKLSVTFSVAHNS